MLYQPLILWSRLIEREKDKISRKQDFEMAVVIFSTQLSWCTKSQSAKSKAKSNKEIKIRWNNDLASSCLVLSHYIITSPRIQSTPVDHSGCFCWPYRVTNHCLLFQITFWHRSQTFVRMLKALIQLFFCIYCKKKKIQFPLNYIYADGSNV